MTTARPQANWRTIDIVVAAVVAVAFGVVFVAWNTVWAVTEPLFAAFPPAQAVLYGVWLLPGVLVGLIVRRPGAAVFGGLVSAAVSALIGSQWGADALISGAAQGLGAELGFALGLYRSWRLPTAVLAGALAGIAATVHDVVVYYAATGVEFWSVYGLAAMLSGALLAGAGGWMLLRALVGTGVLHEFAAGRDQRKV